MKSVLISIRPKWVEKIVKGEKTIEVRKTSPELETPFKAYIYCTKAKEDRYILERHENGFATRLDGKVIGEFVCDKVDDFYCASVPYRRENNLGYGQFIDNGVYKVNGWHEGIVFERNDRYIDTMLNNNDLKEMRLTAQELFDYIGVGKHLYGWRISDLKIYDKPKELSEFKIGCKGCKERDTYHCKFYCYGERPITRPPQSWQYVEGIDE